MLESINIPVIYDRNNDIKSIGQTIVRMSNLSSINCFDSHGNGQSDPVIFTSQTPIIQQRIRYEAADEIHGYQNTNQPQVFYNPSPKVLYNFPISSNFLNNRYIDFTLIMQFMPGDFIDLTTDQEYFDLFHISFIVYDLDEEELLLTSTQDIDFKQIGETLQ